MVAKSRSGPTGLATNPSIPASGQRSRSSAQALAVIARTNVQACPARDSSSDSNSPTTLFQSRASAVRRA